jgi:hypothetical protein
MKVRVLDQEPLQALSYDAMIIRQNKGVHEIDIGLS